MAEAVVARRSVQNKSRLGPELPAQALMPIEALPNQASRFDGCRNGTLWHTALTVAADQLEGNVTGIKHAIAQEITTQGDAIQLYEARPAVQTHYKVMS